MLLTDYRSRNDNRGENYRSEDYRNEAYRSEDNRYEDDQRAEMRRRRDRRGRFMEDDNNTEMRSEGYENRRGYRNEDRRYEGYRNEGSRYENNDETEDYRNEDRMSPSNHQEEYPKPHLLPQRKQPMGFQSNMESEQKLDRQSAKEWSKMMKNEDGSKGAHWTEDQIATYMTQVKYEGDPMEFWLIMNALYSDYCKIANKYGVNHPEFFAELAKAWLDDKDAVPNKAAMYYRCIVKH